MKLKLRCLLHGSHKHFWEYVAIIALSYESRAKIKLLIVSWELWIESNQSGNRSICTKKLIVSKGPKYIKSEGKSVEENGQVR